MDALQPRMIHFADGRPRDGEGQFAPQVEGAPDPNAMAKAYGPGAIANRPAAGVGAMAPGLGGTDLALLAAKVKARRGRGGMV